MSSNTRGKYRQEKQTAATQLPERLPRRTHLRTTVQITVQCASLCVTLSADWPGHHTMVYPRRPDHTAIMRV
jgi:hypothetical protein